MAFGYGYGGYPAPGGYYAPPVPDNLAQLRSGQFQQPIPQQIGQPMAQPNQPQQIVPSVQPVQSAANNSNIIWVNNEKEADDFLVAPNAAVVLWDANQPVVYVKQADATGKPNKEIYDLVKRTPVNASNAPINAPAVPGVEYATVDRVEALEAKFEAFTAKKPQTSKKTVKEDDE